MWRGFLVIQTSLVFALACSSGAREDSGEGGDGARIVPEGLEVEALEGGSGGLEVVAVTLRRGENSTELFAALKNVGDAPACSAALSVELYDRAEQSLAAGVNGLLTQRFYRRADDSNAIAACVGPGDVTMAAITDLPEDLAIDAVGRVVYRCPYFALDVVPIEGLAVERLRRVDRSPGTAYAGQLVNRLDVAVRNPSVTVFTLNRAGRPLAATTASEVGKIAPGGSWEFETGNAGARGSDFIAFPAGALGD